MLCLVGSKLKLEFLGIFSMGIDHSNQLTMKLSVIGRSCMSKQHVLYKDISATFLHFVHYHAIHDDICSKHNILDSWKADGHKINFCKLPSSHRLMSLCSHDTLLQLYIFTLFSQTCHYTNNHSTYHHKRYSKYRAQIIKNLYTQIIMMLILNFEY